MTAARPPFPIFDAHLHLDPEGRSVDAAKEFQKAGGTGLMLVGKPYHSIPCSGAGDFSKNYETTVGLAGRVRSATGLNVLVAVGPHPAELPRLAGELGLDKARQVMLGATERAASFVREGRAHALGEIGRPHFAVSPELWQAANEIMEAGMRAAREAGCAVILHTESATPEVFAELAAIARKAGLPLDKTVKHFSPPVVSVHENAGLFPSVLVGKGAFEKALSQGTRFLVETDYIDDPRRPGAVLGPATVPRRTLDLFARGLLTEEAGFIIHRDNPLKVFGQ
jgi:TatD-related deoxyribonuclease